MEVGKRGVVGEDTVLEVRTREVELKVVRARGVL